MNVSGWTLAEKMALPDWCFGNRQLLGCQIHAVLLGTFYYAIINVVLPAEICIWEFHFWVRTNADMEGTFRLGLRATVPTNEAEMDTATEIFPYIGQAWAGPNKIRLAFRHSTPFVLPIRKGLATGGLKFVVRFFSTVNDVYGDFVFAVSGLPTEIPAHLDPNTI